jgi:hypothetical protein
MTLQIVVDRNTRLIPQMYVQDVKTANMPLWISYNTLAIVEVELNQLIFMNPYSGSVDGIIDKVKNSGFTKVLYDLDSKTIIYDFATEKFLSYNGFILGPKNPVNEIFIVKDGKNKLWKAYGKTGFALLSFLIYYSPRLSSYHMTGFGKKLLIELMAKVYGIVDYTVVDDHLSPLQESTVVLDMPACTVAFDKILEKLPRNTSANKVVVMDINEFVALKEPPKYTVSIKDTMGAFPKEVSDITYSQGLVVLYYWSNLPPTMPATSVCNALNLNTGTVVKFTPDYDPTDYDESNEEYDWRSRFGAI